MIYYDIQHHGGVGNLRWLVAQLDHPRNFINVSYDGSDEGLKRVASAMPDTEGRLQVAKSLPVTWCGPSQIRQMRAMLTKALAHEGWEYFANLSGLDFPLVSQRKLHERLIFEDKQNSKTSFCFGFQPKKAEYWLAENGNENIHKRKYTRLMIYCDDAVNDQFNSGELNPVSEIMQRRALFCEEREDKSLFIRGLTQKELANRKLFWRTNTYFIGRTWMLLHRKQVEWLMESEYFEYVYKHLLETFEPDETLFPTVLFSDHNPFKHELSKNNLRFRLGMPSAINLANIGEVLTSSACFARKLNVDPDRKILNIIRDHIQLDRKTDRMTKKVENHMDNLAFIKDKLVYFYSNNHKPNAASTAYFKRAWVFQQACAVVDFSYRGVNFAFNFFPLENERVKVDLLQRKGPSEFQLEGASNKHIRIVEDAALIDALTVVDAKCLEVIKSISAAKPDIRAPRTKNESKRIGVLTLPLNKNYGGNLQAYAMMQTISALGHEAIFVNRRRPAPDNNSATPTKRPLYSGTVGLSPKLANRKFVDENFARITRVFFSSDELQESIAEYELDGLIVGSDQVWRPKYANTLLADFFLGFIPENSPVRKISYAASFGADSWEYAPVVASRMKSLVSTFDAVSVRESDAVDMCKQHFDITAEHVLDPTMLLAGDHYADKFGLASRRTGDAYLLNYVLDATSDKELAISTLSEQLSVPAHSVNGLPYTSVNALSSNDGDQSVEGWLAAFYNAKYIVTDSFHGVAFSILFNKPFIAYGNPARGLARFTSLLQMFGLEERLVTSSKQVNMSLMTDPISWESVNKRLNELRISSLDFLLKAIVDKQNVTGALKKLGHELSPQNWSVNTGSPLNVFSADDKSPVNDSRGANNGLGIRRFPLRAPSERFTINDVLQQNMCIGCGACSVISNNKVPVTLNHLGLEVADASKVRNLNEEEFERVDSVCPFSDNALNEDELDAPSPSAMSMSHDQVVGRYTSMFAGRRTSEDQVVGSSSGGLTSWLVDQLFKNDKIDAVLHVGRSEGCESLFEYRISTSIAEVEAHRKSNYYPTTLASVLSKVKTAGFKRVAVIGVPCFIKAARLVARQEPSIGQSLRYFIGLVCGHMKSRAFAEANAWQLGVHPDDIEKVDFRKKIPGRNVGQYHFSVIGEGDNTERSAQPTSLIGGNWGHAFFQPNACNYCDDIYAETADVVFGDAWLPKYRSEWRGTNIVVVRNPEFEAIFEEGQLSNEIHTEELSLNEVIQTQFGGLSHRQQGLAVRVKDDRSNGEKYPSKRVDPDKVNLPFWRVELLRQRRKMSQMSSEVFYEAKQRNSLAYFEVKMTGEMAVYSYIENLKNRKIRQF